MTHGATPSDHQTHRKHTYSPSEAGTAAQRPPHWPPPSCASPQHRRCPTRRRSARAARSRHAAASLRSSSGSPREARRERPAHASLAATCGRPAPAPAGLSVARRLSSWPRRQQAAAPLCTSTAGSRARRPWDGRRLAQAPSRAADRAVPGALHDARSGPRPRTQCGWSGGAGKGGAGMGGSNGSPSVHPC